MQHVSGLVTAAGLVLLAAGFPHDFARAADGPVASTARLADGKLQRDFPAMCLDRTGTPWLVYVEHDGKADHLRVAAKTSQGLEPMATLSGPGVIHRPAAACDGKGAVWAIWSKFDDDRGWSLSAGQIVDGKPGAETVTLDGDSGSAIFADAGTDAEGRVWVAWQSFRNALADIYAKCYDPAAGKWSEEIRVTRHEAGDWEPQLVFTADGGTWIVFDSSRNGGFNVYLAKLGLDGPSGLRPLSSSPRYQGRPSAAATPDGKGLWVAWENGRLDWGKNTRGVAGARSGLNADKRVDVIHYDLATGKITPAADVTPVLKTAAAAEAPVGQPAKRPAAGRAKPKPAAVQTLNLPQIAVDGNGAVWLATRYYVRTHWKITLSKYDPDAGTWTKPVTLANSSFGQDRRCRSVRDAQGRLWLAWPSDRRTTKRALTSGVYLAQIDPGAKLPAAKAVKAKPVQVAKASPRWGDHTPERARDDRHSWSVDGKKYGLYWGDFHRHTDISNCITPFDGCIVEQFRYAYDVGRLDLLGTSDHTDVGKPYDPYEWWCNQKLQDVFFVPGFFTSMYVYEREQRWPWGHRNVIFTRRGGPVIYINRNLYKSMPWHATLPAGDGGAEILPQELWKLLVKNGMPVTIISHTGATGMGTDWDGYDQIDNAVENLVEIYQGARVSYEATDTPQPQVGFPIGKKLTTDPHGSVKVGRDFGRYNKGVYQNALRNGYKLGVFANSDHIATHTSFGGVYTESFTRAGIVEAMNARRTVAGTDKIFMEFSCNGHLLGEVFDTAEKPTMKVSVRGTAPLRAVTIVRNEVNIRRFTPKETADFDATFTDQAPIKGENRYYVRVEQTDGNMGWTSPVWVTFEGP